MDKVTEIRIHLPAHRLRALQLQAEQKEAEEAYDADIWSYIQFLREEAEAAGYTLTTDQQESEVAISYSGERAERQAAHDWLHTQPDIWNWIP